VRCSDPPAVKNLEVIQVDRDGKRLVGRRSGVPGSDASWLLRVTYSDLTTRAGPDAAYAPDDPQPDPRRLSEVGHDRPASSEVVRWRTASLG
jgi:hypothetical protein